MSVFYSIILFGLGAGALLIAISAALRKSFFDRTLMVNAFTSYAIAITIVLGLAADTEFYLDVAFIFALIGFISMAAALRYVRHRCLQEDGHHREGVSS